jgi:hypothetical protein
MTKKLIVGGLILVACLWIAKKTNFCSYAGTIISSAKDRIRGEIPRELELARVKHEIQALDRDYQNLLGPIAEQKVEVRRLETEVTNGRANLSERREALLALTTAVENKETSISYHNSTYNLDQARVKMAKEFAEFKRIEVNLSTREKLLEAQRKNLSATLDQLGKLVTQKREFEIRLAQLEAEEALLQAQGTVTPLKTDDTRVADIENTLKQIERDQAVQIEKMKMQATFGTSTNDAPAQTPAVGNPGEIRSYLQGNTTKTEKVAQGSK